MVTLFVQFVLKEAIVWHPVAPLSSKASMTED